MTILFEVTLSEDTASEVTMLVFTEIWIAPPGVNSIPPGTDSEFLLLRDGGINIPLPGSAFVPLSNPADEPTLPGTATDPSDPTHVRTRFLLTLNSDLLTDLRPFGGPNLTPDPSLSITLNGQLDITFAKKKSISAKFQTNVANTLSPQSTLIIVGEPSPPIEPTAPTIDTNKHPSSSTNKTAIIIAVVVVVGLVVLFAVALFVFYKYKFRNKDNEGEAFGPKMPT